LYIERADQAEWKKTVHAHESSAGPHRRREHSGAQEYESVGAEPLQQDGAIPPEQREIERLLEIISHPQPTKLIAIFHQDCRVGKGAHRRQVYAVCASLTA